MNTVVILDSDSKGLVSYKRMLAPFREQMDCKYFLYQEEAVEYVANHPVAVLVCELEMPVMPGREVLEMVERTSPSTVKIATVHVRDVAETLKILNGCSVFRLIAKPFFLVEDLVKPIQAALEHYERQEEERNSRREKEQRLEALNQRNDRLFGQLEEKRRRYDDVSRGVLGVIRGNLNAETTDVAPEESRLLAEVCGELLEEFMRCFLYEEHSYMVHVNELKNRFHKPEEGCCFQIQNRTGQEITGELMQKAAYGMFLGGYLCRRLFHSYRTVMRLEREDSFYVLRMFCQYSGKGELYKMQSGRARRLTGRVVGELAKALSVRQVSGTREKQFAVKLYFESEVEMQ